MSHIQCITYRRKNSHLTYEERLNLEKIIKENDKRPKKDKLSKVCIAKMMGISRATLYRELKRGKTTVMTSHYEFYESYSADIAQDVTAFNATNKGRPSKIEEDPRLIAYFEDTIIHQNYSPDAAIMALKHTANEFNVIISTRTLYNYIDKGYLGTVMMSDLPRQGKRAKRGYRTQIYYCHPYCSHERGTNEVINAIFDGLSLKVLFFLIIHSPSFKLSKIG